MTRVRVVLPSSLLPQRRREEARDGWRVFRSKDTDFQIAIPAYQITRVEAIGKRERDEWYALAMGELFRDSEGVHTVLRDLVPNEWAERGRAHVHMGADAEARVRSLAKDLHPGLLPLGNLHTHPRYGTRPSGTDRAEFWNDPHSVSIIVDPSDRPTLAVYRGRDGEKLEEVTEETSVPKPIARIETSQAEPSPSLPIARRVRALWGVVASGVAGLLVIVSVVLVTALNEDAMPTERMNAGLEARVASLEGAVAAAEYREARREAEERRIADEASEADTQCVFPEP